MIERLTLAKLICQEAGDLTLKYFKRPNLEIIEKADGTPVTQVDRESETLLRDAINKQFPNDHIIGEEHGDKTGSTEWTWTIDPIDGTESFSRGVAQYGILIGLEHHRVPVAGVVFLPALGEFFWGAKGLGSYWRPRPGAAEIRCHVSEINQLSNSLVCTTARGCFDNKNLARLDNVIKIAHRDRGWGDCFGHMLVLTGRADVMIEQGVSRWDLSALLPLVEEAGGVMTNFDGGQVLNGSEVVTSNGHVHDEVIQRMKGN